LTDLIGCSLRLLGRPSRATMTQAKVLNKMRLFRMTPKIHRASEIGAA